MDNVLATLQNLVGAPWLIENLLISLAWVILCTPKKSIPVKLIHLVSLFAAVCGASMLTMAAGMIINIGRLYPPLWGVIHGIVSAVYIMTCSPYQRRTKILLWLVMYNAVLCVADLSGESSYIMGAFFASGAPEGYIRVGVRVAMPLIALYLRKYNFDRFPPIPNSGLWLAAIHVICVQIISFVESSITLGDNSTRWIMLTIYLCMVLTALISARALYTMCLEQQDINELQVERQRYLAEREISHLAESTLEDLRCIRHDLKNQYAYLDILLEGKRYDELAEYFDNLKNNLPPQLNLIDCGNRTVNTVLNFEQRKLRAKELSFEHQLVVPPVLPFKDTDVCSIISNLLDNACEECCRIKVMSNREVKIRLEIHPHQSYLLMRCINTTDRTSLTRKGTGIRTTKAESAQHGYGTQIISKLAEKYNGCAEFSIDNGMFIAQAMLDMTEGVKK